MVKEFDCSRNTILRAIGQMADEGYVQSIHGKGVQIICQPQEQSEFILNGIESLKEAVARNKKSYTTQVVRFAGLAAGWKLLIGNYKDETERAGGMAGGMGKDTVLPKNVPHLHFHQNIVQLWKQIALFAM